MNEQSITEIEKLLREYPFISDDIDRLQKELQWNIELKQELYESLRALVPKEIPIKTQGSDPVFDAVQIIEKIQKEIDRLWKQITTLYDNQLTVKTLLMRLDRNERYVIEARYFKRPPVTWGKIARELHYHRVTCHDIRIRALKKMAKNKTPA